MPDVEVPARQKIGRYVLNLTEGLIGRD